jgi:hypothetical protein
MTDNRAQRLIDEFNAGAASTGGHSIRHGIAQVLCHIADTWAPESVPFWWLEQLAADLTAPTLLEQAMLGDRRAARQFLREAGFTDEHGEWLPQFQPGDDGNG